METCAFNASEIELLNFFNEKFLNWESLKSALRALVSKTLKLVLITIFSEASQSRLSK